MKEGHCAIAKCRLMLLAVSQFVQWKQGGEKIQRHPGSEVIFEL